MRSQVYSMHTLSANSVTFSVTFCARGEIWKLRELVATAERAVVLNAVRSMDMIANVGVGRGTSDESQVSMLVWLWGKVVDRAHGFK